MKHLPLIPAVLLVAYTVYTAFIPITIAHSVIVIALSALFGLAAYLQFQVNPKYTQVLVKLEGELKAELSEQKEKNELRIKMLEDEMSRAAIAKVNGAGISSSSSNRAKTTPIF